jgi:hypothetical protein
MDSKKTGQKQAQRKEAANPEFRIHHRFTLLPSFQFAPGRDVIVLMARLRVGRVLTLESGKRWGISEPREC